MHAWLVQLRNANAAVRAVPYRPYVLTLGAAFAVLATALAIDPVNRRDWALENALVVVLVAALAASHRRLPLSRVSYGCIFLFLCLHEIGAHYTYAQVPYDAWLQAIGAGSLNELMGWERNHYDRLVHFTYGLFMAYPIRELFLRVARVRGFWGYFLPVDVTMSTSALFELIEWGAAALAGGELGAAYLGMQGDIWDAHKDMLMASTGAVVAISLTAAFNAALQRDFAREWNESLRVKHAAPLGEEELARLLDGQV